MGQETTKASPGDPKGAKTNLVAKQHLIPQPPHMHPTRTFLLTLTILTLTACGQSSTPIVQQPVTKTTEQSNSVVLTSPAPTTEATTPPSQKPQYAYVNDLKLQENDTSATIKIDPANWLTAMDKTCSNTAATEKIPQCNPNGFLIENEDKTTQQFKLTSDSQLSILNPVQPDQQKQISIKDLAKIVDDEPAIDRIFIIETKDDTITKLQEQYRP